MTSHSSVSLFQPPLCDDRPLWDVWLGIHRMPSLSIADELGLFPFLESSPSTADEVGTRLDLGPRATEALLGVMQSLGFIARHDGLFRITEVSRNYLLPSSPFYVGGMLRLLRDLPVTHSALLDALRKDKAMAYQGQDMWERHQVDAEQARAFTSAMHSHSFPAALGVARNGDFSGVKRMLDVGGGSACFAIAIAQTHPAMKFTIMELDVVCKLAEGYVKEFGLPDRIDTAAVDMFHDAWPQGYDAVFFSNIFHDWGQTRCEHLVRESFNALPSGGRIYLHETLLNDTNDGPLAASLFSMTMCFFTEGKQRSGRELRALLEAGGFKHVAITHTYGHYSLVSARKP